MTEQKEAVMPAQRRTAPPVNAPTLPAAWGPDAVETFDGRDLTDKEALIGVPFLVTGVDFERNEARGYTVAYLSAMDAHGTRFEFSDTSGTGVKAQIIAHLVKSGKVPPATTPENCDLLEGPVSGLRIPFMKGLRVSGFDVKDSDSGKTRKAKVYYLTGSNAA